MATPFIAGTIADMLDADPNLTPNQVKALLIQTADDFGPSGQDIDYGAGNLNGYNAIKAAGKYSGDPPALPNHYFKQDSISKNKAQDEWTFQVNSTDAPIAITLIMPNWSGFWGSSSVDFDVYLYDPDGQEVARSEDIKRQETVSILPTKPGKYTLKVKSYRGTGKYFFDLSGYTSNLTRTVNN
jgi:serine protease AprX